jgi:hypothetical protein
MRRAARERGEHDHVEVTFEHFAFHTLKLPLATLGVNWQPTVRPAARKVICSRAAREERGAAASP